MYRVMVCLAASVLLTVAVGVSLAVGSRDVPLGVVWAALTGNPVEAADYTAVIIGRLPRTVLGVLAGAALGAGGALIQAVTRNPLADPGVLGITSGAAFAVAIAVAVLGITAPLGYVWFSFAGAFMAAVAVYVIGGAGTAGVSPERLTLAGVALSAVLAGVVSALRLADPQTFNALLVWSVGALRDRSWDRIWPVMLFILVGLVLAAIITKPLNAIALGDDLAAALGTNITRTRIVAVLAVTLLAGGATAMAGPIAFVGLMMPHVSRWLMGPDQRWILALTVLASPVLLLAGDVLGRVVVPPGELPVGLVTAFLGAPVLIVLVRRRMASGL